MKESLQQCYRSCVNITTGQPIPVRRLSWSVFSKNILEKQPEELNIRILMEEKEHCYLERNQELWCQASATPKPEPVPVQKGEPKEVVKPVPIPSPAVSKVTSTTNMAYNKAPRPFGSVSSPKVTSIPSPSSAFTPAHATTSSHASPAPGAAVTPPPFAASGPHANASLSADQRPSALSAGKPAVNVPRQPTVTSMCAETAQEVAEGQRRGSQGDSKQQNGPPRKHIMDRYTEFYHIPTHSDASKKRLIEDTEDWRPRTGTTQSRSFRILAQITGTERMKESETDNTKKANKIRIKFALRKTKYNLFYTSLTISCRCENEEDERILR
ncbi:hypothetical protein J1605_010718 [Eschrichtius robustus]|uniref:DUF4749 domain-containing protein n=1 Tax=Eschrichtius robustus TaxID=9764 RepID=A0AB34GQL4_ESCRO|nr:hypothetical protein J1605_010718 [Eschrichtius robustus]